MAKTKHLIAIIGMIMLLATISFAQVSTGSDNGLATDYVGWDNSMTGFPLNIKHELNQPIHFYTNAGNGTFNNQRMIIDRAPGHAHCRI
jgi:hypothetical protein